MSYASKTRNVLKIYLKIYSCSRKRGRNEDAICSAKVDRPAELLVEGLVSITLVSDGREVGVLADAVQQREVLYGPPHVQTSGYTHSERPLRSVHVAVHDFAAAEQHLLAE